MPPPAISRRPVAAPVVLLLPLVLAAVGAAAAGCAAARPPAAAGEPPWQIPASAFGTQRLYRVSTSGAQGEASFRLALQLAAPDRYQVRAVDPVGRALWTLDVAGPRGLFLDHRARAHCVFEGRFDLSGVPLAPFPLVSLPPLLLGRLPSGPAAELRDGGGEIAYEDSAGRRWQAILDPAGALVTWTAWEGEEPVYWWSRRDGWSILSDRRRRIQVRWRETLVEPSVTLAEPLVPPAGYEPVDCARPD